jgi:flagellar hook-associated protein 1 FlgK
VTSPFFGLDIATRALRAQQTLVDIANQNVANANTPGYSRQTGDMRATLAYPIPVFSASGIPGQLGTGVEVSATRRARDLFVDYQLRSQLSGQGNADVQRDALKQVESVVNEPSANGLSAMLNKYWRGWQEVANSPSDLSVRANLIEQGKAVTNSFQGQVQKFQQQQRDLDQQVGLTVTDINSYAKQIAGLNVQIAQVETTGMHANDLRDQRDMLVDELSKRVKVTSVEASNGEISVYVGNRALVDRDRTNNLQSVVPSGQAFNQVQWLDGTPVTILDGKLAGIITSRDTVVAQRITDLDTLARRLVEAVNSVHASGVGTDGVAGRNFFSANATASTNPGAWAGSISLDPSLTGPNGTSAVAAARPYAITPPPAPPASASWYTFATGDSSNAVALAQVQNALAQRDPNVTAPPALVMSVPSQAVGPATVVGLDMSRGVPGTTYTISSVVPGGAPNFLPTVNVSNGSSSATAALTVATAANGNQIITVDASSIGLRLTVSAPAGTNVDTALGGFSGRTVVTQAGPSTVGGQYGQVVAGIGVVSSSAQTQSTNQQVMVDQFQRQRQQTSGVSLDEEATHLIQYQRAYQASARVISIVDGMLDTLINHTGRG